MPILAVDCISFDYFVQKHTKFGSDSESFSIRLKVRMYTVYLSECVCACVSECGWGGGLCVRVLVGVCESWDCL